LEFPENAVLGARKAAVRLMISNSTGLESMKANLSLQERFPEIKAAIGIFPTVAAEISENDFGEALFFLSENLGNCIAVGEIGLDFYRAKTDSEKQKQVSAFREQVGLAVSSAKPVCVHSRNSILECIELLEKAGAESVLLHWFSGTNEELKRVASNNWMVSFGPAILRGKSAAALVKGAPLESILLETDSPVKFDGKQALPEMVPLVARRVAEIKGLELGEVEAITQQNSLEFFAPKGMR